MRHCALCMWLVGCADGPISNSVLYEDELFASALPGSDRFSPPADLAGAPVGPAPVLVEAHEAMDALSDVVSPMVAAGLALRDVGPQSRSDTLREWAPAGTAAMVDGLTYPFWVRGQVFRAHESADLEWTIELSDSAEGTWEIMGTGRHDPAGYGEVDWDLDETATLLGIPGGPFAPLEIDYDDYAEEDLAIAEYLIPSVFGLPQAWTTAGPSVLGFSAWFELTEDGESQPGSATVIHVPGVGGRSNGVLDVADEELLFESCWRADGTSSWEYGSDGVHTSGAAVNCAVEDLF